MYAELARYAADSLRDIFVLVFVFLSAWVAGSREGRQVGDGVTKETHLGECVTFGSE
tara:strand:+ start:133 stop:303 length:171 start_codon:yes stop_codon:yes gene_type:complete